MEQNKQNNFKKFGLVGKNINYSFSKKYFNNKFIKEKISNCRYENFDIISIEKIKRILEIKDLVGLNVTIPYKESIIPYIDKISEKAKKIGAINTICFLKNGKTFGHNTDAFGFEYALKSKLKQKSNRALILGSGGASKAIRYVLNKNKINYTVVSRKPKTNEINYYEVTEKIIQHHNLIINCTPIGTFPDINLEPKINYSFISKNHFMIDLIYNPVITKFLKNGLKHGCEIMNGESMLIKQAEKSWELWNK
ncbi:MAG: shikimate dehydrogenase [Flavobacteriaceae bacterium]|nr:shikimate dehydrogenase [Flavobacteriaceae bacterium]